MTLRLPPHHPAARRLDADPGERGGGAAGRALRIGVVNVMPRLEQYEPLLLAPLEASPRLVEPVFLRLRSHLYRSSDPAHLSRHYRTLEAALGDGPLDGLIITGAPVEELPFSAVRYFDELSEVVAHARREAESTLGLCWGGLALAALVGVPKRLYPRKLFGVFDHPWRVDEHPLRGAGATLGAHRAAQSRHSGADDAEVDRAAEDGRLRLLASSSEVGHTLFETPDHRLVMHLGHPEYEAARLAFEWRRDQALARPDVDPPAHFDADHPETSWAGDRQSFFDGWLDLVAKGAARR